MLNNKKVNTLNLNIINQIKDIKGKAFTNNDSYYLFINLDLHSNQEEYLTATHEARHIYQLQVVNENDTELEDKKVIEIWENNMKNYLNSNNKNYGYQPLEQDANAFTKYIIKKVFNRDIFVKDINSDFNLWYKKMENDFDDEEIKKCLEYSKFIASKSPVIS